MSVLDISKYPGTLGVDERQPTSPIMRFDKNVQGRDFVVGDIHGMFDHLQRLIEQVDFATDVDRLFSVGDLVDRGPDSDRALEWLAHPWFFACRGNHEQFVLKSHDLEQLEVWVKYNGGDWWLQQTEHDRALFLDAFSALPLVMEICTDTGWVGVVHADVAPRHSWEEFTARLRAHDEDALFYALWSRTRIRGELTDAVTGEMVRIYCGHTPTRDTVQVGNVWFIDTGAVYGCEGYVDARLTLIEIHPESHVEHQISTW